MDQLNHAAWTVRDGAPSNIRAVAQTTDGVLWVGSEDGIFRFDGISFRALRSSPGAGLAGIAVRNMLGDKNGNLWIAFYHGGVGRIRDGLVQNFTRGDGLPAGDPKAFSEDASGVIWVLTSEGIASFDGLRWHAHGSEWNLPKDCMSIFTDAQGTLWVGTKYALLSRKANAASFTEVAADLQSVASIGQSRSGELWLAESTRFVRPAPIQPSGKKGRPIRINVGSSSILFDDQGALWITTLGDGLRRIAQTDQLKRTDIGEFDEGIDIFSRKEGLSHDFQRVVFQDREGSVWTASGSGLDRFRQSRIVPIPSSPGASHFSLATDLKGSILLGAANRPLSILDGNRLKPLHVAPGITGECSGPDGSIWMTWVHSLGVYKNGRLKRIPPPRGSSLLTADAMTVDRAGGLWVSFADTGVYRYSNRRWTNFSELGGRKDAASSMFVDQAGVWFGYEDDSLVLFDGRSVRSTAAGIHVDGVRTITGRGGDIFVGGAGGLGVASGGAFHQILPANHLAFHQVTGLLYVRDDGLWFAERRGIIHIPQEQLRLVLRDPARSVSFESYSYADGLPAPLQLSLRAPSSVATADGRLWFATTEGIVWISRHPTISPIIPPIAKIEEITLGNGSNSTASSLQLAPHTRRLRIDYTTWNSKLAEQAHFRYRLQGLGNGWQDVGTERQASFMGLGPGHYRFEVVTDGGGVTWGPSIAAVVFDIAPAWYQTYLFRFLCFVLVIATLYELYRLRLSHETLQIKLLLKERVHERERIARELHDTLLQSFQGLILRFQAVAASIPQHLEARNRIESVLDRADDVLLEGRSRVLDLRAESITADGLEETLAAFAKDQQAHYTASFQMHANTPTYPSDMGVLDEVSRIGREAIANAFRHSGGKNITCTISYDAYRLSLSVRDDGCGMDPGIVPMGKRGHFGIPGMRERALNLGAQLHIGSHEVGGTEVVLQVPSDIAYRKSSATLTLPGIWRRLRRSSEAPDSSLTK